LRRKIISAKKHPKDLCLIACAISASGDALMRMSEKIAHSLIFTIASSVIVLNNLPSVSAVIKRTNCTTPRLTNMRAFVYLHVDSRSHLPRIITRLLTTTNRHNQSLITRAVKY